MPLNPSIILVFKKGALSAPFLLMKLNWIFENQASKRLMTFPTRRMAAVKAAMIHLLVSLAISVAIAVLIFFIWFPFPYRDLAGGRALFWIILGVDVVSGPLLTAVIFSPSKSKKELTLDILLVALIQISALGIGIKTLYQARPVYLVFEVDRFCVITASDIYSEKLQPEIGGLHTLPNTGPKLISTRAAINSQEYLESLELSLKGIAPSMRPDWWQPYENSKEEVLKRAKPIRTLFEKNTENQIPINQAINNIKISPDLLGWLPVISFRSFEWVALIDKRSAEIITFVPVDGF